MEAFSRTETFPKIVEAYSRPTRIIRGKEIESALEVLAEICTINCDFSSNYGEVLDSQDQPIISLEYSLVQYFSPDSDFV